jgi:hypothetical protein
MPGHSYVYVMLRRGRYYGLSETQPSLTRVEEELTAPACSANELRVLQKGKTTKYALRNSRPVQRREEAWADGTMILCIGVTPSEMQVMIDGVALMPACQNIHFRLARPLPSRPH